MTITIHPGDTCVYAVADGVRYRVSLDDTECNRSHAFVAADRFHIYLTPEDTALLRRTGSFAFPHTTVTLRASADTGG